MMTTATTIWWMFDQHPFEPLSAVWRKSDVASIVWWMFDQLPFEPLSAVWRKSDVASIVWWMLHRLSGGTNRSWLTVCGRHASL
jgi:hypothetical protein